MDKTEPDIFSKNLKPDGKGFNVQLQEDKLRKQIRSAKIIFSELQNELDNHENFKEGVSHLDMKNDTLLSYMIDICNLVLRKVRAQKIEGHRSIERIVEDRVILEKVAGIDNGIKYQLNKLITATETEENPEEEERINIDQLDVEVDSDEESDEDEGDDDHEDDDEISKGSEDEDDDDDVHDSDSSAAGKRDGQTKKAKIKNTKDARDDRPYKAPKLRPVIFERKDREDTVDEMSDKRKRKFEEDNYVRLRAPKRKKVPKTKRKKRSYRARK